MSLRLPVFLATGGGSLEDYLYRLVVRQLLEAGILGELVAAEALQAKEAGGVAFVDGYFQVAGGVEKGQFGAFGHVGIGFADLADHLIAPEEYTELAVFALLIELLAGNIHHHVLEAVDMNDLSFYKLVAHQRLQVVLYIDLLG